MTLGFRGSFVAFSLRMRAAELRSKLLKRKNKKASGRKEAAVNKNLAFASYRKQNCAPRSRCKQGNLLFQGLLSSLTVPSYA